MSRPDPPVLPAHVKGFMSAAEGKALHDAAWDACTLGPVLEIGSYCGLSAHYLGAACRDRGGVLFCVDHHRGSEENQPGWEYHDAELWDEEAKALDTLPHLRRNLRLAGLEDVAVPVVGRSDVVSRHWVQPLGMLFIDGGHTMAAALEDWRGWSGHVRRGGVLAIHDVFPNPADGGRPPFEVYQRALASDLFEEFSTVESLRLLKRL